LAGGRSSPKSGGTGSSDASADFLPRSVVRAVAEDLRLLGRELGITQHAVIAKIRQLLQTLKRVGKSDARCASNDDRTRRSGVLGHQPLELPLQTLNLGLLPDAFAHMIAAIVSVLRNAAV
jgi:hypothetical protein